MRNLAACLVVALAATAMAVTFDFENTDVEGLEAQGWVFADGSGLTGNIEVQSDIVHSGSGALQMGLSDLASYPLGDAYGTLDIWVYDFGYLQSDYDFTSANGPTFGLQKRTTGDWTYPGGATATYTYVYGIGGGLVHRSFLNSNGGFGYEYGQTPDITMVLQDQIDDGSGTWTEQDILDSQTYNGWGRQSWFSAAWMGGGRAEGWNHWQISYEEDGVVVVTLVSSAAGSANITRTATPDTVTGDMHVFDGTYGGGVENIFIWGGSTPFDLGTPEDESWYGDIIVDDITWTPAGPPLMGGDANRDGYVNIQDFVILKQNYNKTSGMTWDEADFNEDGAVDIDDFVILKQNYNKSVYDE